MRGQKGRFVNNNDKDACGGSTSAKDASNALCSGDAIAQTPSEPSGVVDAPQTDMAFDTPLEWALDLIS